MSETRKIEPALSEQEWAAVLETIEIKRERQLAPSADQCAHDIAVANAALPDSDPRKITRATIEDIRSAAEQIQLDPEEYYRGRRLLSFADALASYLPPETP